MFSGFCVRAVCLVLSCVCFVLVLCVGVCVCFLLVVICGLRLCCDWMLCGVACFVCYCCSVCGLNNVSVVL